MRWIDIAVVPERGRPRRWRLPILWFRAGGAFLVAVLVAAVIGAVTWGGLVRRAIEYNWLEAENSRLEMENRRIISVAREVEQSRQILAQIVRTLGGHLELGRPMSSDSSTHLIQAVIGSQVSDQAEELLGSEPLSESGVTAYEMPTHMPVTGFVTQTYVEDFLFPERSHRGIDIAAKAGTPIRAAASGRVIFSAWTPYLGNCVIIAHHNGYITIYGHNSLNLMDVDQGVRRGETIALLGTSGESSAPHLHFEIWKDGVPVDPMEFLQMERTEEF